MSVNNFKELLKHKGHNIVVDTFEESKKPVNVAVLCKTCAEVLLDFEVI